MGRLKKVAILGRGFGWWSVPDDMEKWVTTTLCLQIRPDLCFEIHKEPLKRVRDYCIENNIPLMTYEDYPIDNYIEYFDTDFFSCTICYMLAHAIVEGYHEIHLYGVNFRKADSDYWQKDAVDFWCGYAKGMGIKVIVHGKHSKVLRTKNGLVYGDGRPQKERVE